MTSIKTLVLDIETTPNLAYVWGLWSQNVNLRLLKDSTKVLSWVAKWLGEEEVFFGGGPKVSHKKMIVGMHKLMDAADAVVTYNGNKFDLPHLRREFIEAGLPPPSPAQSIDLYQVVKKQFKFPSAKLEYVAKRLGLGGKAEDGGFDTWLQCMAGSPEAWAKMEAYNRQDVLLTEKLYYKLLPWNTAHPHVGLYEGNPDACSNCGSDNLHARGWAYTKLSQYKRFRCMDCGTWTRGATRLAGVDKRHAL